MDVRLTRRGWGVVGVAVVAFALGTQFGTTALDAVVVPTLVALGAGLFQVVRRDRPSVTRTQPASGFPGETRSVELIVETDLPCDVHEEAGPGLRLVAAERSLPTGGTVTYDAELLARGERALGPVVVTVRGALGLVARTYRDTRTTPVLVYPAILPISDRTPFAGLIEQAGTPDRQAFDALREYAPGDPLRDVNWKSSAKRPGDDLVVTEFAAEDEGGITVTAEADRGHADEMATAVASIAVYLLDADLQVGVVAPGGILDEAGGDDQRTAVLELLARTPAGRIGTDRRADADVRVHADADGVDVDVGGRTYAFADLVETPTETVVGIGTRTRSDSRSRLHPRRTRREPHPEVVT